MIEGYALHLLNGSACPIHPQKLHDNTMNTIPSILIGLAALAAAPFASPGLRAQDASLPPVRVTSSARENALTINVRNCLRDVIVNITDKATGTTTYRKYVCLGDRHSFSLTWWGAAGSYRVCIAPATVVHWNSHRREIVREVELVKGGRNMQVLDIDFEENRPADLAPLPTEEQIDRFCQGDTQALQEYMGDPNRVLLVYVYGRKLEPNPKGGKLYGLVETMELMVMQSTDPAIKAGERLQLALALETGGHEAEILGRFKATPFQPSLMYIINPHKSGEGRLHGESKLNMFPMTERRHYLHLRASHVIQGIPA